MEVDNFPLISISMAGPYGLRRTGRWPKGPTRPFVTAPLIGLRDQTQSELVWHHGISELEYGCLSDIDVCNVFSSYYILVEILLR